ncbi:hypothetical protein ABEB36_010234 [Hypothenemus hampei]|uniref:Protein asteroid n=1 Tax=Hypothenemus hampei TaxID=57062 RepID=A0ABD1EJ35_HYPHA
MGVRGLTTFINNRAHLYLIDYELHDCNVVIDGNSLAATLYKWHCKSNDCFGGDYDKFAVVIENFFQMLWECNVFPYVILDGGYEKRKLKTVIDRMQNKILAAEALHPMTKGSESSFPLFLREVFVDVVLKLNLKVARCEFEGDMEIAAIAQMLNCPVISYDSDFYIFGCMYIPFSTVELTVRRKKCEEPYNYITGKIYHIENFLKTYGGIDRRTLPLLSVLLGNDYINGKLFMPFYKNLKIQKCASNQSDQQKRVKSVIMWLQNETLESAITTILSRFKDKRRQLVHQKILTVMKGYNTVDCELLKFLKIEHAPTLDRQLVVDFEKLNMETRESERDSGSSISDSEDNLEEDINESALTDIFKINYRKCQYPACFMDMLTLHRYYCVPQVEVTTSEQSHAISLDILSIIYKILNSNSKRRLTIVFREGTHIKYMSLENISINVPTLQQIQIMNIDERCSLLLNFLSIENEFKNILDSISMDWHLFFISLKYALDKQILELPLFFSCLLCFLTLNYVDPEIGFYRASKTFEKKYSQLITLLRRNPPNTEFSSFYDLDKDTCLMYMEKMIGYFQMDAKLKFSHKLYDKKLVHTLSQLQSVYLHVKYLNSLLNLPYPIPEVHTIFDGTFLYNMTIDLRKRTNIIEYLQLLLKNCPCILNGITHIYDLVEPHFKTASTGVVKRHKKKKRSKPNVYEEEALMVLDEKNDTVKIFDPNNRYSLLSEL